MKPENPKLLPSALFRIAIAIPFIVMGTASAEAPQLPGGFSMAPPPPAGGTPPPLPRIALPGQLPAAPLPGQPAFALPGQAPAAGLPGAPQKLGNPGLLTATLTPPPPGPAALVAQAGLPAAAPDPSVAAFGGDPTPPPAVAAPAAAPAAAPGAPAAAPDGAARQPLDKKQIRKLLSAEPDPSEVLEPIPDPPPLPKPPPVRKVEQPKPVAASLNSPRSLTSMIPGEVPASPEISIILVDKQFFPNKIRTKEGFQTKLFFTTTNEKPAAIVVEELQIQRWVAQEGEAPPKNEVERAKWEASKEVNKNKVTEIDMDPRRGTYIFHDVISGAKGQIIVE